MQRASDPLASSDQEAGPGKIIGRDEEQNQAKVSKDKGSDYGRALNEQFAKAVVTGLSYFGRGQVVESLVYILELEHSINMNSIVENLPALRSALTKMFGGAEYVIEGKICEALGKQLGVDSEGKTIEFMVSVLKSRIQEFVTQKKTSR